MGGDSECSIKYGSNGAGPGSNVQGGGAFGVTLWKRYLGGDRVDAQGPDGVSPSGGDTDHVDDEKTRGRRIVGVSSSIGGNGICGSPTHRSIH